MLQFWLALFLFFVSHTVISRSGLRGFLIGICGERLYLFLYSLLSIALLAWLIMAAIDAPRVALWPWAHWTYWIPNIAMIFACILLVAGFLVPNPLSVIPRKDGFDPEKPNLTTALTRHPVMWGFFLWSAAHIPPNGEFPLAFMFCLFAVFSLAGLKIIDRKRIREMGEKHWQDAAHNTHAVLFCAKSLRRGQFQVTRRDFAGIGAGFLLYVVFYGAHRPLFGITPLPPL